MISAAAAMDYLMCNMMCNFADQRGRLRTMRLDYQVHSLQKHNDFLDRIHADRDIFEHERAARYGAYRYWTGHDCHSAPVDKTPVLLQHLEHLKQVRQKFRALTDIETDWLSETNGSTKQ